MDKRKNVSHQSDWMKCTSKSKPGRCYWFNKETGETKWCNSEAELTSVKPVPNNENQNQSNAATLQPKWEYKKANTPAQDRLKRLQSRLKIELKQRRKSQEENNNTTKMEVDHPVEEKASKRELRGTVKSQISKEEGGPTTSATAFAIAKSNTKQAIGITMAKSSTKVSTAQVREAKTKASISPRKTTSTPVSSPRKTTSTPVSSPRKTTSTPISSPRKTTSTPVSSPKKTTSTPVSSPKKTTSTPSTSPKKTQTATISAPKKRKTTPVASPENPRRKSSSPLPQVTLEAAATLLKMEKADEESKPAEASNGWNYSNGIIGKITQICKRTLKSATKVLEDGTRRVTKHSFKIPKKEAKLSDNTAFVAQAALDAWQEQNNTATSSTTIPPVVPIPPTFATPKTLPIPAHNRGSANSRLERLRRSLQQQPVSSVSVVPPIVLPFETPNQLQSDGASNAEDANESMDWQPSDDSTNEQALTSSIATDLLNQCINTSTANISVASNSSDGIMSEYYDTVSENLLRLSSEKQQNVKNARQQQWLPDYYYFVVDTNVLLDHLTFIDDLSKMKLCDTKGSILYIPYTVLQELDKLKLRHVSEGTKTLAVRAIKYLNEKFESKNRHIQAQSAIAERQRIIDVSSADDSIINCCLQIKQHVPQLILLTEDVNLRNKAICNDLLVSTKSDLVSKHASSISNNTITITTTTITSSSTATAWQAKE